jgi:DNA-binding SARP family transcriptional activator/tetratricopeptide (TPR) repeat protein
VSKDEISSVRGAEPRLRHCYEASLASSPGDSLPATVITANVVVKLLGPLEASADGRAIEPGAGRLRVLLATLAIAAGQPVSNSLLATALWGDDPPVNPRRAVQTYITRLRGAVGDELISTRPGGYLLEAIPDNVDVLRFGRLLDGAEAIADLGERRARVEAALDLWRGDPFQDLRSAWLESVVAPPLIERRLTAIERLVDLDLAQGLPGDLVSLQEFAAVHPLRESLWLRLITLLAQHGRPGEALARYEIIRARLADELGTDPGPELRAIYTDLLTGSVRFRPIETASSAVVATMPSAPTELPPIPNEFTGRAKELAAFERPQRDEAAAVTLICGLPGAGKTALALGAAHRIADRFPDGQLFVDLRGYTHGAAPMEPAEALERILRSLGVGGDAIPPDPAQRAALLRSRTANRRFLLLLDNAAAEDQVAPLVLGAPGCHTLITSRRRLTALDQLHTVLLDGLPTSEAVALLRNAAGTGRLASTPAADLRDVVGMCGHLPLALRIAAGRLRSHPELTAAELAERLREHITRLGELDAGPRSVAAGLDLSYQQLPNDQRQAYRSLGLHPGTDIDVGALAALVNAETAEARRLLDELLEANLIQELTSGRYRQHDLVRLHAAAMAARQDDDVQRRAASDRLLTYYVRTASSAVDAAYPDERERRPKVVPCGSFRQPQTAIAWLDAELPNLLAAARQGTRGGRPQDLVDLSGVLSGYLQVRSRNGDAEALHSIALDTARITGDRAGRLRALLGLGGAYRRQDRVTDAIKAYTEARRLAQEKGDAAAEVDVLTNLGHLSRRSRHLTDSLNHYSQALDLARVAHHDVGEVDALIGLGRVRLLERRYADAVATFASAEQLSRAIGYRGGALRAAAGLGDGYRCLDQHRLAAAHFGQVLTAAREFGDRNWEMESLHGLGRIHYALGRPKEAVDYHRLALRLATELAQPGDQARALDGLAEGYLARGDIATARRRWREALDIFDRFGLTSTDEGQVTVAEVRRKLDGLGAGFE